MSEEIESLRKIAKTIDTVCSIYLISFGLISNIISFIIYKRKVFSKQSIGTYLSWLSILNLIAVLTLFQNLFVKFEWTKTLIYCKFYVYLHYINIQYCSWILVINSFDHLLSVTMAFKYKIKLLREKCYQIIILLIVLLILFLINIPLLFNSYFNESTCECDLYQKYNYLIAILDMLVCTLIPFLLMTISTSIITIRLFKWKHDTHSIRTQNDSRRNMRKTQFARTVIGINLLFLICNLPISIILIIINYKNANGSNTTPSIDQKLLDAKLELSYKIFHMLMYSHNATPLIIYLICNKLFRQEFLIFFRIKNKDYDSIRGKQTRKRHTTVN